MKKRFQNQRFLTAGINQRIHPALQMLMWLMIEEVAEADYLQIFELEKKEPKIRGYYIGENKLITLMMKMDADMVVMTTPDLQKYHIKKSMVRDDIEYV